MWQLQKTESFERTLKWYLKKHTEATGATLTNLETYMTLLHALKDGVHPSIIQAGFIHTEAMGAIALDQTKGKRDKDGKRTMAKLIQLRLYLYADHTTQIAHLITIGDKASQHDNVQACRKFIVELRKAQDVKQK